MADQKSRPVPKRRSVHLGTIRGEEFSTTDLYGSAQDLQTNTRTLAESCPDKSGLPSCVQRKNVDVSSDQKNRDSTLPRLLFQLDEACKKYSNDEEKSNLANLCMQAASSPIRKYRILQFFQVLENNKDDIDKLPGALSILEKYAINLLRDDKPPQWKVLKYNISIIQNLVFPVKGALDVLKQMGYTQVTENALTFPAEVDKPNIQSIIVLSADLSIARHETDALMRNTHPFLIFNKSGTIPASAGGNMSDAAIQGGGFCGVCSEQNLATNCDECDMQFCLQCDERWHYHKLRRNHIRTSLFAAKDEASEEKRRRPVPVPRQRKSQISEVRIQDPSAGNEELNRAASPGNYFPHDPSGSQEIKRPPSHSPGDMTSPMTSPSNMMSPSNMTSPMTSPSNMMSPSNMTSPSNMNIHVNPSQQRLNDMYGAFVPQSGSPYSGHNQGFNQSGSGPHDFSQSGSRPQDFLQSGSSVPNQSDHKILHRVLSCPNCSLLYPDSQQRCPSCDISLNQSRDGQFSPSGQQGFNLNTAAAKLPTSNLPSGNSNQQSLLKDIANAQELANRTLPDRPRGPGVATRVNQMGNTYEDVDDLLEWTCEHCTFMNPLTTKVCQTCCKTPSDLKKFPNLVEMN